MSFIPQEGIFKLSLSKGDRYLTKVVKTGYSLNHCKFESVLGSSAVVCHAEEAYKLQMIRSEGEKLKTLKFSPLLFLNEKLIDFSSFGENNSMLGVITDLENVLTFTVFLLSGLCEKGFIDENDIIYTTKLNKGLNVKYDRMRLEISPMGESLFIFKEDLECRSSKIYLYALKGFRKDFQSDSGYELKFQEFFSFCSLKFKDMKVHSYIGPFKMGVLLTILCESEDRSMKKRNSILTVEVFFDDYKNWKMDELSELYLNDNDRMSLVGCEEIVKKNDGELVMVGKKRGIFLLDYHVGESE